MNKEQAIIHYYLTWNILEGKKFDNRFPPDLSPFFRFYDNPVHPDYCIHYLKKETCALCDQCRICTKYNPVKQKCKRRICNFKYSPRTIKLLYNYFVPFNEDHPYSIYWPKKGDIIDSPKQLDHKYRKWVSTLSPIVEKVYDRQLGNQWPEEYVEFIRDRSGTEEGERFSIELTNVFPPCGKVKRKDDEESIYYRDEKDIVEFRHEIVKFGLVKNWILPKTFESEVCCNDTDLMRDIRVWSQTGQWENEISVIDYRKKIGEVGFEDGHEEYEINLDETKVFLTDGTQIKRFWNGEWSHKIWKWDEKNGAKFELISGWRWNEEIKSKVELISERTVNRMWAFNLNETGSKTNRTGDETAGYAATTWHQKIKLGKNEIIRIDGDLESVELDSGLTKVWVWASHGIPYQYIGNKKLPIKDTSRIKGNLYALIYPEWEIETLHKSSIDRGWNWLFEPQNYSMPYPEKDLSPGLHIWKKIFFSKEPIDRGTIDSEITEEEDWEIIEGESEEEDEQDEEEEEEEEDEEKEKERWMADMKREVWKETGKNWDSWHGSGDDPEDNAWGHKGEIKPHIIKMKKDEYGNVVDYDCYPWHQKNEMELIELLDKKMGYQMGIEESTVEQIEAMHFQDGMSIQEIADQLGVDKGFVSRTVKKLTNLKVLKTFWNQVEKEGILEIFGTIYRKEDGK